MAALDSAGAHWFARDGKLCPREDLFGEIRHAMHRHADALKTQDVCFDKFLARLRGDLSADAVAFARSLIEGYNAANPARFSAREAVDEWSGDAAADGALFRPLGGYAALLESLAAVLVKNHAQLHLQSVVETVRWKRGQAEAAGSFLGRPFRVRAPRAIVTLPLGVMQLPRGAPGAVRFAPALNDKRAALRKLAAGAAVKVALQFRTPFWEKLDRGRYRDVTFFHSANASFPTFWTALPVRTAMLTAWSGGPRAQRLSTGGVADIVRRCVTSLESIFGKRADVASQLVAASVHDWLGDPYCRGAYSHVMPGGQGAREALARPLADTLYFAGEAADVGGEAGTVGGALQSGIRAARESLRRG